MAATAVMTLRIDPELLAALKAKARREGRSASSEVVRLLRLDLDLPAEAPRVRRKRAMGMFSQFDAPERSAFADARREASAKLLRGLRRRSR